VGEWRCRGCEGAAAAAAEEPPCLYRVLTGGPVGLMALLSWSAATAASAAAPCALLGCEGLLLLGLKKVEAERGGVGARGCRDAKLKRDAVPLGLVDAGIRRALA